MKTYRSMVLVSSDPLSMERGAQQIYNQIQKELDSLGICGRSFSYHGWGCWTT